MNGQTQNAAPNAVAALPAATSLSSEAQVEPTAEPHALASTSSQVIASAASSTTAQPTSATPPPAEPSANPASAADVSVANFLASTLGDDFSHGESEMAALAFATGLSADANSTDEPGADPLVAAAPADESSETGSAESDSSMLLEDPDTGEATDEQLTDQALDEQESWLEELVA
jgi:hypothetical protein